MSPALPSPKWPCVVAAVPAISRSATARTEHSGSPTRNKPAELRKSYSGQHITIHDNRGICSHAGYCTDNLKSAFKLGEDPWIDTDGAITQEIIDTIKQCPSGALSYSIDNIEYRDQDRPPMVTVTKNGPYAVTGVVELLDQKMGDGASSEHYALCRCGASKNKPFCDGSHWHIGFED